MSENCAVILAGGEGKRMKSQKPKVLCDVLFKPMIDWVIDAAKDAGISDICVVTGHLSEYVKAHLGDSCETVLQKECLGTGHAVMQARDFILRHGDANVLVLNGDAPLMDKETIKNALQYHINCKNAVTVISAHVKKPFGYGRIVRDMTGFLSCIVEAKDADEKTRQIDEVNSGAFWFSIPALLDVLGKITNSNNQKEYYLTDAVGLLISGGFRAAAYTTSCPDVVLGANDRSELMDLNNRARKIILKKFMADGVDIPCQDGIIIGPDVEIGADTKILPGTILRGKVKIGKGCEIGPNSLVENSIIGDFSTFNYSMCTQSQIKDNATIGPFVHIRPNSNISNNVHVGNFVEIKNSNIDDGTKVPHLTYVGDSDVGKHVNFGCGCVTVNFTGKEKFRTTVKDNAFIGCNTNLVAPVTVGKYGFTAAGSTITENVPDNALGIARAKQVNKEGWVLKKKPYRNMDKK